MTLKNIGVLTISALLTLSYVMPLAAAAEGTYPQQARSEAKVNFTAASEEPTPVDPTDPNNPKPLDPNDNDHPGTRGTLRFDRVPVLDFGEIETLGETIYPAVRDDVYTYQDSGLTKFYAAPTVQITDVRGSNKGWTASVSASTFEAYDENGIAVPNSVLEQAVITFNHGKVASLSGIEGEQYTPTMTAGIKLNSESKPFAEAKAGKGMGKWGVSFVDDVNSDNNYPIKHTEAGTRNQAITLKVAATDKKLPAYTYKSVLTWSISDEPSNL